MHLAIYLTTLLYFPLPFSAPWPPTVPWPGLYTFSATRIELYQMVVQCNNDSDGEHFNIASISIYGNSYSTRTTGTSYASEIYWARESCWEHSENVYVESHFKFWLTNTAGRCSGKQSPRLVEASYKFSLHSPSISWSSPGRYVQLCHGFTIIYPEIIQLCILKCANYPVLRQVCMTFW